MSDSPVPDQALAALAAGTVPDDRPGDPTKAWFEAVLRDSDDFFTLVDSNFTYLAANDAYCEAHGLAREEVLGRTIADLWGAEAFKASIEGPLRRCLAGEEVHYDAWIEFRRSGRRRYDVSFYPWPADDGGPGRALVVTRDITRRVTAEQETQLIRRLTEAISAADDPGTAQARMLREVCASTGWPYAQVWVPSGDELVSGTQWHALEPAAAAFHRASTSLRFRRGAGLPGRVWASGRPVQIRDLFGDGEFTRRAAARECGFRAALALPVTVDGRVVAVMEFLQHRAGPDDDRLIGLVQAATAQLAGLLGRTMTAADLRESQRRWAALIESANDVIFYLKPDGSFSELNPAFERLTGWPRSAWIGRPFAPLLHPDDRPVALERFRAIMAGEPPRRREYRVQRRDGSYAIGEFTLTPQITNGTHAGIFGIGRDITERKRAEHDLRVLLDILQAITGTEELAATCRAVLTRLAAILGCPVAELWVPAPDGSLLPFAAVVPAADPAAGGLVAAGTALGLREDVGLPARLLRAGTAEAFPDLSVDPLFLRAGLAEAAGLRAAFAVPVRAQDRAVGFLLFFAPGPPPDPAGRGALAATVGAELGALLVRERTLEQLDCFFSQSLDLHCLAGFDGFLKRVNRSWERTLGFTVEELLSRPYLELVHPDDRAAAVAELEKLRRGEDVKAFEVRCPCKDGGFKWTLWNATSLPGQRLIVATGRDITERKRTEVAVLQSEEHYRDLFHQAYRMQERLRQLSDRVLEVQEQERTRISRDLHDEVGQALTAINVNLAVIRKSLHRASPHVVRRMADTQRLLEQTMENVHRFARELRPAMLDDLGLVPALRSYVKSFTERTGLPVGFRAERDAAIERLDIGRKTVVFRVVQEGLNNIAKHAGATKVEVLLTPSRPRVQLEVRDDGVGFDAAGPGTGTNSGRLGLLGLSERVRLVGGDFAIESAPGRGTTLRAGIPFKSI